eukprot:jgi/Botrbrau1/292/Bobra.0022s0259.1
MNRPIQPLGWHGFLIACPWACRTPLLEKDSSVHDPAHAETRLRKHHQYSPWPPYLHEGPWPPPSITKPLKKITDRPMCIQLVPGWWRATPSSG